MIELVGLEEKSRRAREDALRRAEAPARSRRRPCRGSRSRLPRRADDRLRPGGAPNGLGDDPRAPRARQDDPADDALPRRGAAARRPGRGAPRGRDRPDRDAGRADRRCADVADPLPRERRGPSSIETETPTRVAGTSSRPRASPRVASSKGSRCGAPTLEDVYLDLVDDARRRPRVSALPAPAAGRADGLLAQPRVGDLHLHLPDPALPAARRPSTAETIDGRPGGVRAARRADRLRRREHGASPGSRSRS